MALLLAWEAVAVFKYDNETRAKLGRELENHYLGLASGIMDQFICLTGEKSRILHLDCRSLDFEFLPFPSTASILVVDSGVRRDLSQSGYNHRLEDCHQALATLQSKMPALKTLRDLSVRNFEKHLELLTTRQQKRVRHVVLECERVNTAAKALRQSDLSLLGQLMYSSHSSSRDQYEVSTPELDLLVETAVNSEGCYGARLSGGGFGGCATALVRDQAVEGVSERLKGAFKKKFGRQPDLFACSIGAGARITPYDNSSTLDCST
jgi:galactokinase